MKNIKQTAIKMGEKRHILIHKMLTDISPQLRQETLIERAKQSFAMFKMLKGNKKEVKTQVNDFILNELHDLDKDFRDYAHLARESKNEKYFEYQLKIEKELESLTR